MSVSTTYWAIADELTALRRRAKVAASRQAPHDEDLVLELDRVGGVVGVRHVDPSRLTLEQWLRHPDRAQLPADIDDAVDRWVREQPGATWSESLATDGADG